MLFLTPNDFTGRFELHTGMFDQPKLVDYIQRYESHYLIQLLGANMYDQLQSDYDPLTSSFWSPNFEFLANPFHVDVNNGFGETIISDGMKTMLLGFIYWEYIKDTINQMTPIGNVIPQNQNSTPNSTIYSSMWSRYNESIKTFRAIQRWLILNRPLEIGQATANGIQFSVGSLYLSQLYQTINFDSIQYNSATSFMVQTAGTGYTSLSNVVLVSGVIVNVVANGSGNVTSVSIVNGGSGLAVNQTLTIPTGNGNCVIKVLTIDNIVVVNPNGSGMEVIVGAKGINGVKLFTINTFGTGYTNATQVLTTGGSGNGCKVNVTTNGSGVVTSIVIAKTGQGFTIGDQLTISAGNNDAKFTINSMWNGEIESISFDSTTQGGSGYSIGDTLLIDGGDEHGVITLGYVGIGDAKNWNGRDKQTSYWI
jgi:hypothetical protein